MPTAATLTRTFHARDPSWEDKAIDDLPYYWRCDGYVRAMGYLSDKWETLGDRYRYTHPVEAPTVGLYVACEEDEGCERAPRWPTSWACLGTCWQMEYEDFDGDLMEPIMPRGSWLSVSPSGRLFIVHHKTKGFICAVTGEGLHVTEHGIEG